MSTRITAFTGNGWHLAGLYHDDQSERAVFVTSDLPKRQCNGAVGCAAARFDLAFGDPFVRPERLLRSRRLENEQLSGKREQEDSRHTNVPNVHLSCLVVVAALRFPEKARLARRGG